ncbi:hypothetical protein [Desulfonema magnum]|uniref:Uncharacterized protein n=1 Tax=Desulfonema magnum TaxID=45655 RepID=A0A975BIA8_9BACT|nr:hypothetical protein [Desulfonema magnum]QTA85570.1 Uncharacterized protein dnm_015810 [Desulfonema magnum]
MTAKQICMGFMGLLLFSVINAPQVYAGPPVHVGILEPTPAVAPGTRAGACFSLFREGKEIRAYWDMPVHIGDEIRPRKKGCVLLVYVRTGCKKLEISRNTTVRLPEEITIAARHDRKEGTKLLSKGSDEACPCFPPDLLCFSPLPENGSTILAGEAVLFRWYADPRHVAPCAKVRLVIMPPDKTSPRIEEDMQAGELKTVKGDFKPGEIYQWFVEKPDYTRLSEKYGFSVLSQKDSDGIRGQLDHIRTLYADASPVLYQALYLQFISHAASGRELNLYPDSLRLFKDYLDETDIAFRLIENLKRHYEKNKP